jgi:cytochrome c biogenesis protein CcdA
VYGDSPTDDTVHVVVKKLTEYKFRSLFILKDGFNAWQKAGYQIEQGAGSLVDSSNIVYFYIPGCQSCIWAKKYLGKLLKGTDLLVLEKSMILKDNQKLREIYDEVYNVPADKRGIVPAVFKGSVALVGKDDIKKNLRGALDELAGEPISIHLRDNEDSDRLNGNVKSRFEAFSPISIIAAGLLDGVNPCAFAVLVFFISYLAFTGKEGQRLLWIGIIFIGAIFATYFLLGIGIFNFLHVLKRFQIIINFIYIATALVALTFAFYNITDSIKARKGDTKGLALQLSDRVKRLTHEIIRKHASSKYIFIVAGFTGFLISLFEFGCTGQIYLPTIVYILNMPGMKYRALTFLGLYNVMFIVPLLFILVAVTLFEVNTTRIGQLFKERIYIVKICTGGFFLFLAGYMIYISFRNFGLLV